MAPEIPEGWKRLNVHDYRRELRVAQYKGYPPELVIKRQANSPNIYCCWLPPIYLDNRKKATGKKRRELSATTQETEPQAAAKAAIKWSQEILEKLRQNRDDQEADPENSLHHFWAILKPELEKDLRGKRNSNRRIKDEISKFEGQAYGIGNQNWSTKSIEDINYSDLSQYWELLNSRSTETADMAETKRQQRALINKLFETARKHGHPHLKNPQYPTISRYISKQPPGYLSQIQWNSLLETVILLSDGHAKLDFSQNQYSHLKHSEYRPNESHRNFVDLYDSLLLMWFWYLRAEDLPRLKVEYFSIDEEDLTDPQVKLAMKELKGFRKAYPTHNWRPDALVFFKRMLKRRPSGYLVAPHKQRVARSENESQVKKFLNDRLGYALKQAGLPIHDEYGKSITMHNIRHTAFMLTFIEFEELRTDEEVLADFARNANTDIEMLRETYLNHIGRNQSGRKARQTLKPSTYTLSRRISKEL
jgi:hypothetical protein